MANFSYSDPSSSDKDAIRFLIGDTGPDEWFVSNEEISWTVNKWKPVWGTNEYVASVLAENIAAKYAREAVISADGVSIGLGQVSQQYRDLALSLRQQHDGLLVGGFPDVGGVSPGEGLLPGVKPFSFGLGMHDDIEAGLQEYGGIIPVPFPIEEFPE